LKRKLIDDLVTWKDSNHNIPVLLCGARGVGKSYIAMDFGKSFYTDYIYINFEQEPYKTALFHHEDNSTIIGELTKHYPVMDTMDSVLLILDEISYGYGILQEIIRLSTVKTLHIIMISSYEEDRINPLEIKRMNLYPLDFEEFLGAIGKEWYIEVIKTHYNLNKKVPDIVHKELLTIFQDYLLIGGMPSAVNEFISLENQFNVKEQHKLLLNSYLEDIPENYDSLKIRQIITSLDKQVVKDNQKFQFTLLRKGATLGIYSDALMFIQKSYYGIICKKAGEEDIETTENILNLPDGHSRFKLYLQDTGMLNTLIHKNLYGDIKLNLTKEKIIRGLYTNYVAQCLTANGYQLFFWESNSQAKIDFIIKKNNCYVPIEVKISENTRSKNVSVFRTKYFHINESIKISTKNFDYTNDTKYVPVYAAFCI
jgi:predicted AAA+ superfamily ATPase